MTSFVPIKCGAWRRPYKMEGGGGGGDEVLEDISIGTFSFCNGNFTKSEIESPKDC